MNHSEMTKREFDRLTNRIKKSGNVIEYNIIMERIIELLTISGDHKTAEQIKKYLKG